jgi:2-keto-4-pentenoate hydratase
LTAPDPSAATAPDHSTTVPAHSATAPDHSAATAALITSARLDGRLLGDLGDQGRPPTELAAYRVQAIAHRLLEAAGFGRQAGWKIGCTTKVMQAYLGIGNPCAGAMFAANVWHGQHAFPVPAVGRLGVECEIAVRMGRDLPRREQAYEPADMPGAVAASMAAIEVVADRYVDYPSLDTPTLIADDFFHHACVLGPQRESRSPESLRPESLRPESLRPESLRPESLREVTGAMTINGREVGRGVGTDILGDPLVVLCWLANSCAAWGTPLLAGDVILLGSLVQTQWVKAGDVVAVTNDPLGEVAAEFLPPDPR